MVVANVAPEGTRERLLDAIKDCGSYAAAARRAGIAPMTAYRWRASDPAFAAQCAEAKREAVESLEHCFYETAMGVNGKPSFLHGIAWLKANDPDGKYRDNVQLDINHSGTVGIVDLTRLADDLKAQLLAQAAQRYLTPEDVDSGHTTPVQAPPVQVL